MKCEGGFVVKTVHLSNAKTLRYMVCIFQVEQQNLRNAVRRFIGHWQHTAVSKLEIPNRINFARGTFLLRCPCNGHLRHLRCSVAMKLLLVKSTSLWMYQSQLQCKYMQKNRILIRMLVSKYTYLSLSSLAIKWKNW